MWRHSFLVQSTLCWLLVISCAGAGERPSITVLAYENEGFLSPDSEGQPTGFEADLVNRFAARENLRLSIEWVESFDRLLPEMRSRDANTIAVGMVTITEERERLFDFSDPYFPTRIVVLSKYDDNYRSLEDLRGARIATLRNSTYEEAFAQVPGVSMIYGKSDAELFELVARGEADALGVDSPVAAVQAPKHADLHVRFAASELQYLGFAVNRGSPLKAKLDAFLREARESGDYRSLLVAHFGELGLTIAEEDAGSHTAPTSG